MLVKKTIGKQCKCINHCALSGNNEEPIMPTINNPISPKILPFSHTDFEITHPELFTNDDDIISNGHLNKLNVIILLYVFKYIYSAFGELTCIICDTILLNTKTRGINPSFCDENVKILQYLHCIGLIFYQCFP